MKKKRQDNNNDNNNLEGEIQKEEQNIESENNLKASDFDSLGKTFALIYQFPKDFNDNENIEQDCFDFFSNLFDAKRYHISFDKQENKLKIYCYHSNFIVPFKGVTILNDWKFKGNYPTIVKLDKKKKWNQIKELKNSDWIIFESEKLKKKRKESENEESENETNGKNEKKEKKEKTKKKRKTQKEEKEEKEEEKEEKKERKKEKKEKKDKTIKKVARFGYGKKNDNVGTPKWLYDALNEIHNFDHDPCPLSEEIIIDGLDVKNKWGKSNFINPPYSRIDRWITRAIREMIENGSKSVFILPIRLSNVYWDNLIFKFASEFIILGKIKFEGYDAPSPFPVGCIVFDPNKKNKDHSLDKIKLAEKFYNRLFLF